MSTFSDPGLWVAGLAFLGLVAGTVAGLFGVGGGILIIPALAALFKTNGFPPDVTMHAAMGVSMMTVVATSVSSLRTHARHDAIDRTTVVLWAPMVIAGALLGSLIAAYLSGIVLSLVFAVFLAGMAVFLGLLPPHLHALKTVPSLAARRIMAFMIGCFSALIGIGGGSLSVPALVMCRTPIHRAIGTASVIGLLISLPAALVFLVLQLIHGVPSSGLEPEKGISPLLRFDLMAVATLVPATTLAAPFGARLAHKLNAAGLRRSFALLLAIIAAKMFYGAFYR